MIDTSENKVVKSVEVKSMPPNVQITFSGKEVWVAVVPYVILILALVAFNVYLFLLPKAYRM